MGRRPFTANQKAYRRRKREEGKKTKRLKDGTTRPAQTVKGFWVSPEVKQHLDELVIERVQSQGQIISDLITRCLGQALKKQSKKGRRARRPGRNKDAIQITVLIKNSALKMLQQYRELSGETMSAIVSSLILSAKIEPVLDDIAARAHFDRNEERQKQKESDEQEIAKYGQLLRLLKTRVSKEAYQMEKMQRKIHEELEDEHGPLDY